MNEKTQGFVLQSIRYGDHDLIVKVYTLSNGLQTFMVKGVRGKSSRNRAAFFQPLTFLNFVQKTKLPSKTMCFMSDVEVAYAYQTIPNVMNKSAILMYVAELLSHSLTQQESNPQLYTFVEHSLVWLDLVEEGYANFPLYFTLELSRFLGFYPQTNYSEHAMFDMMEGRFVSAAPLHPYYFNEEDSLLFAQLLNKGIDELPRVSMTGAMRSNLLEGIITFMRLHAPLLKGLQSHEVLKEVLR